jgi:hypothetical protein
MTTPTLVIAQQFSSALILSLRSHSLEEKNSTRFSKQTVI